MGLFSTAFAPLAIFAKDPDEYESDLFEDLGGAVSGTFGLIKLIVMLPFWALCLAVAVPVYVIKGLIGYIREKGGCAIGFQFLLGAAAVVFPFLYFSGAKWPYWVGIGFGLAAIIGHKTVNDDGGFFRGALRVMARMIGFAGILVCILKLLGKPVF